MSDQAYRNFAAIEEELLGSKVCLLEKKSRHIMIMNDSDSADLQFRFTEAESWGTLKATESLSLNLTEEKIILRTSVAVPFRVWAFG